MDLFAFVHYFCKVLEVIEASFAKDISDFIL